MQITLTTKRIRQQGASAVEYALALAVITTMVMAGAKLMNKPIEATFKNVGECAKSFFLDCGGSSSNDNVSESSEPEKTEVAALGSIIKFCLKNPKKCFGKSPGSKLPIAASAQKKIADLSTKFGKNTDDIINHGMKGNRYKDVSNNGNVNIFSSRPDGKTGYMRITLDPTGKRIISAGLNSNNNVVNGINTGRFVPLK